MKKLEINEGAPTYRLFAALTPAEFVLVKGPLGVTDELRRNWKREQRRVKRVLKMWDKVRGRPAVSRLERARLHAAVNAGLALAVTARVDDTRIYPVARPGSPLLGALWLELARAVLGAKRKSNQAECRHCGRVFTMARSDAKFCSGACRLKAKRARDRSGA